MGLLLVGLLVPLAAGQTAGQLPGREASPTPLTAEAVQTLLDQARDLLAGAPPSEAAVQTATQPVVPGETEAAPTAAAAPAAIPVAEASASAPPSGRVEHSEAGLLDVNVRNIDIATLLELLSYEAQANIVTSTSVSGRVSANLYQVTLEQVLDAILTPNKYRFCRLNGTIFVGTGEELNALRPPPPTQVFRLRYVQAAEAEAAVRAVLGPDANVVKSAAPATGGGGDDGGGTTMGVAGIDYLIVTDYPERLAIVAQVLEEIDRRPQQVLIESTILRATLNEQNQFGIDFSMLGGVDFQDVGSTSAAATNLVLGELPADDFQSTTFNVSTDFTGNVGDGGFTFGLIKDSIAGFVRALEEITDVVVVANPKIVALNKQEAEVIVGRRDGYLTTTVTETAAVQTVEFLETGTQIKFRPLINEDNTVRLVVHPKDSNGGLNAANLPFEETTEAHADILVNDGHTVLIGGLFRERTVNSDTQLPVLGNIPGLGLLFGSRSDQTIREEVIILLTVHVLKEDGPEQDEYAALLDDIERIRVGSRMGLLASGRERLAQAFYHEALAQIEAGDFDRALLNTRMTLNNQPKHLPAITLKERLMHERMWDEEGTRMRTFIWRLIPPLPVMPPDLPPALLGRPDIEGDLQPLPEETEGVPQP